MNNKIRILIIGTLSPPRCGTSLLLKILVDSLRERGDVISTVINTAGIRGGGIKGLFLFARTIVHIAKAARNVDIVTVHSNTSGLHVIGPAVVLLARLARRPVIVRKFAGTDIRTYGWLRRNLILWACRRATLYLAETKKQTDIAEELSIPRIKWFPNNRPMRYLDKPRPERRRKCCRFVYLGNIRREKGILEIITASKRLGEGITVDLYGGVDFDIPEDAFAGLKGIQFQGDLPPEDVTTTLSRYDAFLLPSFHPGEGYPGAILAAYEVGLPVICTRWNSLPELVDDRTGILIEPHDADALFNAMQRLSDDEALYARLREGVKKQREQFSSDVWNECFVEYCREATR